MIRRTFRYHTCYLLIILFALISMSYLYLFYSSLQIRFTYRNNIFTLDLSSSKMSEEIEPPPRTLIVYIYGKTHQMSEENLSFFIRTAVRASHNADYYFIIQRINGSIFDEKQFPSLPSNAHYVFHENKCFDLGTIGWFLLSDMIDVNKYKYFIFLNSSIRGPFIVAYYDQPIWFTIFTRRLIHPIKLVGCTISCQTAIHVQSYLWTMDRQTVEWFLENSTILGCHRSMTDTIHKGEIAASQMILNAGYGIDSLMVKYQGIDFRYNQSKKCLHRLNPTVNKGTNGITLDPYEVVFIKMKGVDFQDLDNRERVRVYEKWLSH